MRRARPRTIDRNPHLPCTCCISRPLQTARNCTTAWQVISHDVAVSARPVGQPRGRPAFPADTGRPPGICDPARRRASGRICAARRRAVGLADRVHRLGGHGDRAGAAGGDLRRRALHAAGRRPDRSGSVRGAPHHRPAGRGLAAGGAHRRRAARLRSVAPHRRGRGTAAHGLRGGRRGAGAGR